MKYQLHPEAALEHEEQVAYYEERASGLGGRYHAEFKSVVARICETPDHYMIVSPPDTRRSSLKGFPFSIIFRESGGTIQILAVAHHRRRPRYWAARL